MIKKIIKNLIKEVLADYLNEIKLKTPKIAFNTNNMFWYQFFNETLTNIAIDIDYYDENMYLQSSKTNYKNIKELYNFVKDKKIPADMAYLKNSKLYIYFRYKNQKRTELYAPFITNFNPIDNNNLILFYEDIEKQISSNKEHLL
jgi:hypothetical protein